MAEQHSPHGRPWSSQAAFAIGYATTGGTRLARCVSATPPHGEGVSAVVSEVDGDGVSDGIRRPRSPARHSACLRRVLEDCREGGRRSVQEGPGQYQGEPVYQGQPAYQGQPVYQGQPYPGQRPYQGRPYRGQLDLGEIRRWSFHLAAIAVLLVLSVLQCRSLLGAPSSSVPANRFSGDDGQGVWYMAWLPFALGHGLDPFISHLQFAPAGFNLLSNTGMLFPALSCRRSPLPPDPSWPSMSASLLLPLCPEGACISCAVASVWDGLGGS
jgi:hypothetical protein